MTTGGSYRLKAAELHAKAKTESNALARTELELLAQSYLRLAEQADRNAQLDLTYETPPPRPIQQQPPNEK
jgi:hypothetical protein